MSYLDPRGHLDRSRSCMWPKAEKWYMEILQDNDPLLSICEHLFRDYRQDTPDAHLTLMPKSPGMQWP